MIRAKLDWHVPGESGVSSRADPPPPRLHRQRKALSGFDASEFLELDWPSDFAFPADLDCGDVDVATGTQFMLSTTSTGCAVTATTWGALFMSDTRVLRLTAPSDPGTYIATGTVITFTIGLNALAQQTGTTQIVNPSTVGTYALNVGGVVGTGRMLVAIIGGLQKPDALKSLFKQE